MQPESGRISYTAQLFNWLQNAPTLWQVIAYLFPAVATAVTGVLARLQETPVPWHLVIFYSLGVFCFSIVAMFVILKMKWEMTLKYKLTCDDFSVEIINEGQNNVSVILKSYFNNMSSMLPIQYAVKDISFLLQSKGNDQAPDHFDAHSLSPGAFSPVTWPAIHNIDIRAPIKGTLKFNVDYGVPGQKQKRRLIQKIGVDLAISRKRDKYEILQMIAVETQTYH